MVDVTITLTKHINKEDHNNHMVTPAISPALATWQPTLAVVFILSDTYHDNHML